MASMASTHITSPDSISASEFRDVLERYPACVAAISDAKGGTLPGPQPTGLLCAQAAQLL